MLKLKFLHLIILVFILTLCSIIPIHATPNKYDDLGRLTQFFYENGDSVIYSYDAAGNIINSTFIQGDSAPDPTSHIVIFTVDGYSFVGNVEVSGDLIQIVPHGGSATEPTITRANALVFNGWSAPFDNVTENINTTADWLRIGAVTTEGRGNAVTSADLVWLARSVAGHTGFEILFDKRISNLRGDDRLPTLSDVTAFARWLSGYELEYLVSLMPAEVN